MHTDISPHENWFCAYAARMRLREHENPAPLDLKLAHSLNVLAEAQCIIAHENFAPLTARACLLAALYHDTARFEQYLRWRTFRDADSCNHGVAAVKILKYEKCLAHEEPYLRKLTLAGVIMHNRFALPVGLPEQTAIVAHVVRDADKLDILRVMDEHLSKPGPYNATVVLRLPDDPEKHSPAVVQAALQGRTAAYADLRSVNDFRLLLGTWAHDMHFAASRERFVAAGHARRVLESLPDAVYGPARDVLLRQLAAISVQGGTKA